MPRDRNGRAISPFFSYLLVFLVIWMSCSLKNHEKQFYYCSILLKVLFFKFLFFLEKFFHSLNWIPLGTHLYLSPITNTHVKGQKRAIVTTFQKLKRGKSFLSLRIYLPHEILEKLALFSEGGPVIGSQFDHLQGL